MTEIRQKSFTQPDGTLDFPNISVQQVELGDIVVSSTTRALARGSEFEFEPRGVHALRGLDGEWELFALKMTA